MSINGDLGPVVESNMNYIKLAQIKHGVEIDLDEILSHRDEITQVFNAAVESCKTHGTSLPVNLRKNGDLIVKKTESTRALMTFLRVCARLEGAAILCRKRGIVKNGKQTTQSLYKLLL